MSAAVVRCPVCRGEARVAAEALGLEVRCPRCDSIFIAEVAEVAPLPRVSRNPTVIESSDPAPRRRESRRRPTKRRESELEPERPRPQTPEPDHDPHRIPPGALPVSVLIGLALLPFAIPMLWLVGPAVLGEESMLSIATPIALAISASVLCLAVIYTVDWTPSTRVKGVLMLVGLTFFAAVSLYFLKKDLVERFQKMMGFDEKIRWKTFRPPQGKGDYEVKMPGEAKANLDQPLRSFPLECFSGSHPISMIGQYVFVSGWAKLGAGRNANDPKPGTKAWFEKLSDEIVQVTGGTKHDQEMIEYDGTPEKGMEFQLELGEQLRFVRIYLIRDNIYYLSAERPRVYENDDPARQFFNFFQVIKARN